MKKLFVVLLTLGSISAFANTTCSALCGYYSGTTLTLLKNPGFDTTSWKNSTQNFLEIDEKCQERVLQEVGRNVQAVLLAEKVIAVSSTKAITKIVHALAVDSCRSEK